MIPLDNYKTLLLDASYRPVRVIPWNRAICMDFDGKIYVVERYNRVVRSPSVEWPVPAVVVLRNTHRYRSVHVPFSRRNVFLRDKYTCQYCGKLTNKDDLTLDHIIPKSQGGPYTWDNLITACTSCNHKKGNRTPEQAGMIPLSKPRQPSRALFGLIQAGQIPPEWTDYLV